VERTIRRYEGGSAGGSLPPARAIDQFDGSGGVSRPAVTARGCGGTDDSYFFFRTAVDQRLMSWDLCG